MLIEVEGPIEVKAPPSNREAVIILQLIPILGIAMIPPLIPVLNRKQRLDRRTVGMQLHIAPTAQALLVPQVTARLPFLIPLFRKAVSRFPILLFLHPNMGAMAIMVPPPKHPLGNPLLTAVEIPLVIVLSGAGAIAKPLVDKLFNPPYDANAVMIVNVITK